MAEGNGQEDPVMMAPTASPLRNNPYGGSRRNEVSSSETVRVLLSFVCPKMG